MKDLAKESVWVNTSEDMFESDDLFKELEDHFATKAAREYHSGVAVDILFIY